MNKTKTKADAGTNWRQQVYEKINRKIIALQQEFEELLLLRHVANEVRRFRMRLNEEYD